MPEQTWPLADAARLVEREPRAARVQARGVTVAQVQQKDRFPLAVRKELGVHLVAVESAEGAAVQTERARRQYQIGALHRPDLVRCALTLIGRPARDVVRADAMTHSLG